MDEKEVLCMSKYLQDLELALRYYDETELQVDFESEKNVSVFFWRR